MSRRPSSQLPGVLPHPRLPLALACIGLAACGSGGGGGGALLLAGTVRSPDGQALGFAQRGGPRPAPRGAGGREGIELAGLLPVPDGTSVELVRLDATGAVVESLASTTTAGGLYTFDLTSLDLVLSGDLVVAAGSGATTLRALAGREDLDVDPLSEVLAQMVLGTGAEPLDFTVEELADLSGALELQARLEDFTAQPDLAATLADWLLAAQNDPDFTAFLAATAAPGQTNAGPGDIGDYFPGSVGNAWGLVGELVEDGSAPVAYTKARRIEAEDAGGVLTVTERESLDSSADEELLMETATGVLYVGNSDPSDPVNTVTPFELVRFPLRAGESWEQFDARGVSLGVDLDGDLRDEVVDVSATRTVAGFEDVVVPAGTFADCVRLDTLQRTVIVFTSGPRATATLTQSDWFAPHVGPLKAVSDQLVAGASILATEERSEELASYQAEDQGHGILPAHVLAMDLAAAGSNQEDPGRPGLAFDGSRYLAVTTRVGLTTTHLVGLFLSPTGVPESEVQLFDRGAGAGEARPAVVFDGTNHLVVFQDGGILTGLRVSPAGSVLDPTGFPISLTGSSNFQPAVAFDGTNALVVWRKFDTPTSGDVFGARVTPGGAVLGEFPILAAPGDQLDPALVFGAGNYLVVFADEGSGTRRARATRVTPGAAVLDPAGFDLAPVGQAGNEPRASFEGTNYLAVWTRPAAQGQDLVAVRVAPDGTLVDPGPIALAVTGALLVHPSVAFDGANHLVSWQIDAFGSAGGIRAARLSPAGALLDGTSATGGIVVATPPASSRLVYPALVRGATNLLLAWIGNIELAGETKDLEGTLVYPF